MHQHKGIVVGTVAVTRGSRVPVLNDGLLVVVVDIGHRMDFNRYRIRLVTGQPLPCVGNHFYNRLSAKISAARLLPIDDFPHAPLTAAKQELISRSLRAGGRETLARDSMTEMRP